MIELLKSENLTAIDEKIKMSICTLCNGLKRTECEVVIEDNITPISITAYWVKDIIRIDIKFK
jgi:hypothetical protein